jgi:Ser/Thr protein kinase RdoA (MazF antagonist)
MVWAMLGVVRPPDEVERYEVGDADGRRLLRLVEPGGRATTFELSGDTVLGAVQSRGDTLVGRLTLVRGANGRVVHADAQDFERRARLVFDITGRTPSGGFPAQVWRRP